MGSVRRGRPDCGTGSGMAPGIISRGLRWGNAGSFAVVHRFCKLRENGGENDTFAPERGKVQGCYCLSGVGIHKKPTSASRKGGQLTRSCPRRKAGRRGGKSMKKPMLKRKSRIHGRTLDGLRKGSQHGQKNKPFDFDQDFLVRRTRQSFRKH